MVLVEYISQMQTEWLIINTPQGLANLVIKHIEFNLLIQGGNMKRTNRPNRNGYIEIDFDGNVKAGFKIENGNIIVIDAMDGYGVPIKIEK